MSLPLPAHSAKPTDHPSSETGSRKKNGLRRSQFLKWLRKVHGWVGLWGAVLGLLFGVTGFLQNHRAVLKISTPAPVRTQIQVAVPEPHPRDARAFAAWLAESLQLGNVRPRIMREPAQQVTWGGQTVMQPEHWEVRFNSPRYSVSADYWKDANTARVTRNDNGWVSIIENLHKASGVGIGWILLADSIAGSLVLLSITGVILWTELNRRRTVGFCIFVASLVAMVALALPSL